MHLPTDIQNDREKSPSSPLFRCNGLGVLPVPVQQKCMAPSYVKMPTFLDASGVYDQHWRPNVKQKDRSIATVSTENYKALFACAVNYIFILLA